MNAVDLVYPCLRARVAGDSYLGGGGFVVLIYVRDGSFETMFGRLSGVV